MMRRWVIAACCGLVLASGAAHCEPLSLRPAVPEAVLQPLPGAELPLDTRFADHLGRTVALRRYFDTRPVLLVLGDYRCAQLCGLAMQSLLGALHDADIPRREFRIVRVSIDPQAGPDIARERLAADLAHAELLEGADKPTVPLDLTLLTGDPPAIAAVAHSVGYRYSRLDEALPAGQRFAHPTVVVVATRQGRVSSYLSGVQFDPSALRLALAAAGDGRALDLSDRIALLCAHLDPRLGRHSGAVIDGLRFAGLGVLAALAVAAWRSESRRRAR